MEQLSKLVTIKRWEMAIFGNLSPWDSAAREVDLTDDLHGSRLLGHRGARHAFESTKLAKQSGLH